jgi:hypothetical protein
MAPVAKIAIRTTFAVMALGAAAACGSDGGLGLYGGELGPDFGVVGSGGGGLGYRRDSGTDGSAGQIHDGGTTSSDAGHPDGGNVGGNGNGSDASSGGGGGGDGGGSGNNVVDAGSGVGVTFSLPPGFFASLDWVISGPSGYYSGTVYFGEAHSIEFVAGGIQAGSGYTMTIAGTDRYGDPCSGTSAPFQVLPGQVAGAAVVLTCQEPLGDASDPGFVTTGSVGVDAGLAFSDH